MIYQLLIRLLAPIILIITLLDAVKRKGGWRFVKQRLGFGFPISRPANPKPIWIHCASVGEVKAIEALVKSQPNQAWLISTNTPTGLQTAQQLQLPAQTLYLPLDWPYAIRRVIHAYQPAQLWVVETELWPNLYQACYQANIPITLINARLSRKSLNAPNWLKAQYQACLSRTDRILARSETEAQRYIHMGANPDKVQALGNLKQAGLKNLPVYPRIIERDYVLLASSHQDEERQIAQRWQQLQRPELLVIVPRHTKRAAKIQQQLQVAGIDALLADTQPVQPNTSVIIKNTFGELMPLFAHAELVIMGGSFVPKGGHNFLEPAALGKAIITGPDNSDFADELLEFQQNGAIILCPDYDKLQQRINQLMTNGALRKELGDNARRTIQNQPDILQDYLTQLFVKNG